MAKCQMNDQVGTQQISRDGASPARIVFSGLTGRVGLPALEISREREDVQIIAGITRMPMNSICEKNGVSLEGVKWLRYSDLAFPFWQIKEADVIVDFSHPSNIGMIMTLAVMLRKPLIIGTSGLSEITLNDIRQYTPVIPIFCSGVFSFKVKHFINAAIKMAERNTGRLELHENFYQGKKLPSEAAKILRKGVYEATGRNVEIFSENKYPRESLISDWEFRVYRGASPRKPLQDSVRCHTEGFRDIASDVLTIARIMATKPINSERFYSLDDIWKEVYPAN